MLRLYLYARVRIPCAQLHTRPRVQRAPGLPCALIPSRAGSDAKPGRFPRRGNTDAHPRRCLIVESEIYPRRVRTGAGTTWKARRLYDQATVRLFFCLHLLIEMAMTYFRRTESQEKEEKSRQRSFANEIRNMAGEGKTWVNFWGQ